MTTDKKPAAGKRSSAGKRKATQKPGSSAATLAALAAAGLGAQEALASTAGSELARPAQRNDQPPAEAMALEADAPQAESQADDQAQAQSAEDVAAGGQNEAVQLADASGALGIQTDAAQMPLESAEAPAEEPIQLAQASTTTAAPAAGGTAAAGAEAGVVTEGFAGVGFAPIAAVGVGLAALAGGGGGAAAAAVVAPALTGIGGFAAKGPLNNATAFYDVNGNGKLDAGEPTAPVVLGLFTFNLSSDQLTAVVGKNIVVQGGTYTDKDGNTVNFLGKLIAPPGLAEVTPFSTLKTAGVSDALIKALLGGRDLEDLGVDDFSGSSRIEAFAQSLMNLLSDPALGLTGDFSSDKLEFIASSVGRTLQAALDAGVDFSQPGALDDVMVLARAGAQSAASLYDDSANADGTISDAALASAETALKTQDVLGLAQLQGNLVRIAIEKYAAAHGATAEFDAAGNFVAYHVSESNLSGLSGDLFGADSDAPVAGDLILDVEGTLLGSAAQPITFSQLNALGVDLVLADSPEGSDSPDAPYLRLTVGNIDANPDFGIEDNDMAGGGLVIGTELPSGVTTIALDLGADITPDNVLAGFLGSSGWDDPLDQD